MPNPFDEDNDRHLPPGWTDEDVQRLVAKVSKRVIDSFYQEVGRTIVTRIIRTIGWMAVAGLLVFAGIKGKSWLQ